LGASVLACDEAIVPTHWQASCFPKPLRERMHVIHDGIRTDELTPNASAWISLGREGLRLSQGDEVVTFVNRNLEPMRGYHQFMRALPRILAERPRAHVVIVGGDGVSYGTAHVSGESYKNIYLNEVRERLDMSRVHFVNRVPYKVLISLLRLSAAHVYLTVPFVLSWSMLEAMSVGALVIGSDTAPVREVIEHGHNGLLVDFFSPEQIASAVCLALADPQAHAHLRVAARQTVVERYDFHTRSLPAYMALIEGRQAAPGAGQG
jgi:glycosyltransferase involved in cell wall biosynthesis